MLKMDRHSKILSIRDPFWQTIGVYCEKMPEDIFNYLKDSINNKDYTKYNHALAGNIREEYNIMSLLKEDLHSYLLKLTTNPMYDNYMSEMCVLTEDRLFQVNNLWVNYMKKNEFNPVHYHDGLYSWNIIVKIPYDLDEELKNAPGAKSNTNTASCLAFHRTGYLGHIETIYCGLTKEDEGHIMFFPSRLRHSVNPFYSSDDYRITISGNIFLNPNKKMIQ